MTTAARDRALVGLAGNLDSPQPTIAAVVRERTGATWSKARQLCIDGRVTVDGERCFDPASRVAPDAVVVVAETAPKQRASALPESAIVFFDRDVVVVDKPAGMLSVADEAGNKDTLGVHTRTLLRRVGNRADDAALGVVHRLDRDTSGVIGLRAHRRRAAHARGAVSRPRRRSRLPGDRPRGCRRGAHRDGPGPRSRRRAAWLAWPLQACEGSASG